MSLNYSKFPFDNKTLNLIEQDCEIETITITATTEELTICDGETIDLEGPSGYQVYLWNNDSETQNHPDWCNVNDLPLLRCINNINPEDNWTNQRCSDSYGRPFYVKQGSHNIFLREDQSDIHHEICCTEDIQSINFEDNVIIPVSQTMNNYFNR